VKAAKGSTCHFKGARAVGWKITPQKGTFVRGGKEGGLVKRKSVSGGIPNPLGIRRKGMNCVELFLKDGSEEG